MAGAARAQAAPAAVRSAEEVVVTTGSRISATGFTTHFDAGDGAGCARDDGER